DLGARAFTYGRHVYYGHGQTPENVRLTAHELSHVVQQSHAPNAPHIQRDPLPGAKAPAASPTLPADVPADLRELILKSPSLLKLTEDVDALVVKKGGKTTEGTISFNRELATQLAALRGRIEAESSAVTLEASKETIKALKTYLYTKLA